MTHHAFSRAYRHAIKQGADCLALRCVIEHRGCSMRINVIDVGRGNLSALERLLHRLPRSDAGWLRLCDVKVVGGNAVTDDFGENMRAALASEAEIFQGQNRSAFAKHHARPMPI